MVTLAFLAGCLAGGFVTAGIILLAVFLYGDGPVYDT